MSSALVFDQLCLIGFFALIIFAALSDISSFRIPNNVSLGLLALFPFHLFLSPTPVDWAGSLIVGGGVLVAGFSLFARGLVGAGDVKLLSATALWAGRPLIGSELMVMALAGGVLAAGLMLVQLARRVRTDGLIGMLMPATGPAMAAARPKLPYGVAIGAGAFYVGTKLLAG